MRSAIRLGKVSALSGLLPLVHQLLDVGIGEMVLSKVMGSLYPESQDLSQVNYSFFRLHGSSAVKWDPCQARDESALAVVDNVGKKP